MAGVLIDLVRVSYRRATPFMSEQDLEIVH